MIFICSDCKHVLQEKKLHNGVYYKCESCGLTIEKSAIFTALDENIVSLLPYNQNMELDGKQEYTFINLFMDHIIEHIENYKKSIDLNVVEDLIDIILESDRIFIFGVGRSGFVGKNFIIKLVELDLESFFYGENTSPPIKKNDCLIALSGSGETKAVIESAKNAKEKGCKIISLTSNPNSSLAKLSDTVWIIGGDEKEHDDALEYDERLITGEYIKLTTMGTLFELTASLMLNSFTGELILKLNRSVGEMQRKKFNLHSDQSGD
ncbi:MAG: SIS domain-containing protein [Methanobrevibacter sp.]|jgi:6-phospho-3-hexuloisomerase|nr:SIS domain-containing protein [Candidatus Methanovirga meridionalis]